MWLVVLLVACSAGYYVQRGQDALDAHRLPQAESAFRKAIARDPTNAQALAGLGWTYHLAGHVEPARGAFERCEAVAPADPECLRGQASTALAQGNPARARALLSRGQTLAPHDPGVQSSLALLDLNAGDVEGAARRYEGLVRRFPEAGEYKLGLGEARFEQRRFDACLELVEQGLESPDLPVRYRGMLNVLKARALVASTADRVDPDDCEATAPPVRIWLDAADAALDAAQATGVDNPAVPSARRLVLRRRAMVDDDCPVPVVFRETRD